MNCFEWQNRSSDYLDGTLIGVQKKEADEHLESCESCAHRHEHYRTIIESISHQPRSSLPIPIRKAPFSAALPRGEISNPFSRWERAPWFVRTSLEAIGVAAVILFVVAMVPRIRNMYEKSLEQKLDTFLVSEISPDDASRDSAPLMRGKQNNGSPGVPPLATGTGAEHAADEFNTEGESESDSSDDEVVGKKGDPIRVGSSEIWRFNLKTDSPREIRPKIVQTLTELHIPADTPGLGGIEAPGGIQFDLLVSQALIPSIKASLEDLAGSSTALGQVKPKLANDDSTVNEAFTWYKNKSKKKIPTGKARVVIWLSQL